MAFMVGSWQLTADGRSRFLPTANRQPSTSQLLRRKDHVLAEVAARAPRLAIEVGVGLADGLLHVHPQFRGDGANGIDRPFDLEVVADRGAIEHHFALAQMP